MTKLEELKAAAEAELHAARDVADAARAAAYTAAWYAYKAKLKKIREERQDD